jgi:small neutral amino acid transporter SnatA (MarC family)
MIFDDKMKSRLGIMCLIPAVCFLICLVYYISLLISPREADRIGSVVVNVTDRNYTTLFVMIAIAAISEAPVFIYCLIILAKMKNMNSERKIMWVLFLSLMAPIASAIFWLFLIKNADYRTPVYPDFD